MKNQWAETIKYSLSAKIRQYTWRMQIKHAFPNRFPTRRRIKTHWIKHIVLKSEFGHPYETLSESADSRLAGACAVVVSLRSSICDASWLLSLSDAQQMQVSYLWIPSVPLWSGSLSPQIQSRRTAQHKNPEKPITTFRYLESLVFAAEEQWHLFFFHKRIVLYYPWSRVRNGFKCLNLESS